MSKPAPIPPSTKAAKPAAQAAPRARKSGTAPAQAAAKASAPPAVKAAAKPRVRATAPTAKAAPRALPPPAAAAVAAPAPLSTKQKHKLVRDSFTIPKDEYAVLTGLKQRAAKLAHHAKKSEVLRAGVQLLSALPDAAFLAALQAVPSLKTGRPKQEPAPPAPQPAKVAATARKKG